MSAIVMQKWPQSSASRNELYEYITVVANCSSYWTNAKKLQFYLQKKEAPKSKYIPPNLESLGKTKLTSHWALIAQTEDDAFEFSIELTPKLNRGGVLEYAGCASVSIEGLLTMVDNIYDTKNFKSYNIITRNCQEFVLEILSKLGIQTENFQITAKRASIGLGLVGAAAAGMYLAMKQKEREEDREKENKME